MRIFNCKNNSKIYPNLIIITLLLFLPPYAYAGSSCFLPGTLISLENGSRIPIEHVKIGDKLISFDKDLNKVITEVLETENPIREDYYIIVFGNGKELKLTDEHPLYIKSGKYEGWGSIIPEATMDDADIKTKKIKVGDYVLNIEKKWIKIINLKHINEKVQTYNLKKVDKTNTFFAEGFLAHNKGKPCTPSSPPPCSYRNGCYNKADAHVDYGSLAPEDFGSYYGVNACIRSEHPNGCGGTNECICASGVYVDEAKEAEPDVSSGACACIAGTDWNAIGRCCGDDGDDCGRINTGVLCSITANRDLANWISSEPNLGDIRYVGCGRAEYLSDGTDWIKCDGAFWRRTVGSSEYLCIGKGRESIVECCGDGSCKSRIGGERLATGQSVNPGTYEGGVAVADNRTYYCRSDNQFVTELDVPNSQINDKALIAKNKATCEKAGFIWTGTKCCSEADDINEYYNDPDGKGGCWDKKPIISVNFVEGTNSSVVNYKGEFHGCAVAESNFNTVNDVILNIPDKHTGGPLITDNDYCTADPGNNYYCSYTEKWLPTEGTDRTHLSFAPLRNAKQAAECCPQNECWDGETCIDNQKNNPSAQPINGSRCIDGEWTNSTPVFTPDDSVSGFCPKNTQCLVTVFGSEKHCVESGQYVDDNYCEDGIWSSRTKLLALKLLKLKSGDFTLFCDNRENTLNNLQYLTESGDIVANILTNLQTNNFCVLKAGSKVVAAASINKNLEDIPRNSLNIFGVTNCDSALMDDGQYHSCDATNKVWFNKRLKSFIYSSTSITVPSDEASFEEFIKNPIKSIIDSIKRLITPPPFDESYVKGIKKFNKLYMLQQGSKTIQGSIEGRNFKNAVIAYSGFDTDICDFIEQFNKEKKDVVSGISCKKEGNNYYVLAQGSQFTSLNPESIWLDLTSKLRLK